MSLQHPANVESLIEASRDKPKHHHKERSGRGLQAASYGARYTTQDLPRDKFPEQGCEAEAAYQLIHDMTDLDGRPNLNLASFVHTWMPPQADKLMAENVGKNLIDEDEYPATVDMHHRCTSMIAKLWHAHPDETPIGTATTGSSEGILLGGMALKRAWQAKMKAKGKNIYEPGPNIIMGANAQVCLEKFARYFEVEARLVPVSEESRYCLDIKKAAEMCDENTIGVFVILGSTYTGHYESVKEMSDALDKIEKEKGWDIPIHVDGASGGFFAPFVHPKLEWDFRLPRVKSIQSSGHKFGLAYVGVGWVVWRDHKYLPKELIFELHYLGSVELSFSLNFSRPAAPIIAQFFSFLHLGFEGYRRIGEGDLVNARILSRALEGSTEFKVLSEIHHEASPNDPGYVEDETKAGHYKPGLPVVAFQLSPEWKKKNPYIQQKWLQTLLRVKGWIVPNYELPPSVEKEEVLRVVVRESMSEDLVDLLLRDLFAIVKELDSMDDSENIATVAHRSQQAVQKQANPKHVPHHKKAKGDKAKSLSVPC